jgi:sugar phosphate isomerase/epimerase
VPAASSTRPPFGYSLNTSTISGTLAEKIDAAAAAGFQGIEPWVRELDEHVKGGGKLEDVRKNVEDKGLTVVNLIGFFEWAVDDQARRQKGLDEARRNMDLAWQMGCSRVAAPPFGITDAPPVHPLHLAERYRALLEVGSEYGVEPILEFWGMSKNLGRLSEAVAVCMDCGYAQACVLVDVFHMYKRGSPFEGLRFLTGETIGLVHINDYPAQPPRADITDKQRVMPGDGVAPLRDVLCDLHAGGYRGMLSLELFNDQVWQMGPVVGAKIGLEKMRTVVTNAFASREAR